jgi:hypothetical protein
VGEPTKSRRTKDKKTPAGAGPGSAADPAADLGSGSEKAWDAFGAQFDDWWESLSDAELDAMTRYEASWYGPMNQYLRNGYGEEKYGRAAEAMSAALGRARLDRDTIVYRGVGDIYNMLGGEPGDKIGHVFREKGFLSTSLSRAIAQEFASTSTATHLNAVMRIRVPQGTRAAYYTKKKAGISSYLERELVIGAGAKLRITGVRKGGKLAGTNMTYRYTVDAEIIP